MADTVNIPQYMSDAFIHVKDGVGTERVIFPITRFDCILNAPKMVDDMANHNGARFLLYSTKKVELTDEQIRSMFNYDI